MYTRHKDTSTRPLGSEHGSFGLASTCLTPSQPYGHPDAEPPPPRNVDVPLPRETNMAFVLETL